VLRAGRERRIRPCEDLRGNARRGYKKTTIQLPNARPVNWRALTSPPRTKFRFDSPPKTDGDDLVPSLRHIQPHINLTALNSQVSQAVASELIVLPVQLAIPVAPRLKSICPNLRTRNFSQRGKNSAFFQKVHVDPYRLIRWNDEIELRPDSLYVKLTGETAEQFLAKSAGATAHA
jgi:hypothetical protein